MSYPVPKLCFPLCCGGGVDNNRLLSLLELNVSVELFDNASVPEDNGLIYYLLAFARNFVRLKVDILSHGSLFFGIKSTLCVIPHYNLYQCPSKSVQPFKRKRVTNIHCMSNKPTATAHLLLSAHRFL